MLGESQYFVDLGRCFSIEELLHAVLHHYQQHPYLKWLVGNFTPYVRVLVYEISRHRY